MRQRVSPGELRVEPHLAPHKEDYLRQTSEVGNVTSRSQEFAGGSPDAELFVGNTAAGLL